MRVANCRIVRREIEEIDKGQRFSASVTEHLAGCGKCQRFNDERRKLRQMVAGLETVAAPPDFDLRVRSRLANERAGAGAGFLFSGFTFGIPSVAFAALALVVGGVFALRTWVAPSTNVAADKTETHETSKLSSQGEQPPANEAVVRSKPDNRLLETAKVNSGETIRGDRQPRKRIHLRNAVASSRKGRPLATKEFSSMEAPVIKKEEAVASLESQVFPIEASSQPLRLSLDYSGGVSRTILVPALSFGSERVLAGDGLSLVKNSRKGAW